MSNRFWWGIGVVALVMALCDLPRAGLIYFRVGPFENAPGRTDAYRRWRETHYVLRGRNPYDVAFAYIPPIARVVNPSDPRTAGRSTEIMPDLGWPEGVVYPPWAFPSFMAFFWPGVGAYLNYYGLWMVLGIAGVACWAGMKVRTADVAISGGGWVPAVAVALCVLGCSAWGGAVVVGNNPPVVIGALVATFVLLEQKHPWWAGVALAVALLKPTVAGPFLLPLLLGRRWRTVVSAGGVVVLESLLTWRLTWTNPIDMLRQMTVMSRFYAGEGFGPTQYLIRAGVFPTTAEAVVAVVVLAVGVLAMLGVRRRSLLAQFAVAAVIARLWAYHLDYDDAILVFLLVYCAVWLERSRSAGAVVMFLLVCGSLWLPGYWTQHMLPLQVAELLIWTVGAVVVVFWNESDRSVRLPVSGLVMAEP